MNGETDAILITKRDGSCEPFRVAKLRRCFALVLRRGQCDVSRVADALARAVSCHLEQWDESRLPSSGYIYQCACTVLRQTGLGDAARRLASHRRQRVAKRRRLHVFDPLGETERIAEPWQKARVVSVMKERYGVTHAVARALAGEVEERVFALGCREVSKPLVEELIRNELAGWGLGVEAVAEMRGAPSDGPMVGRQPGRRDDGSAS